MLSHQRQRRIAATKARAGNILGFGQRLHIGRKRRF